jgi:hypothetical protein
VKQKVPNRPFLRRKKDLTALIYLGLSSCKRKIPFRKEKRGVRSKKAPQKLRVHDPTLEKERLLASSTEIEPLVSQHTF